MPPTGNLSRKCWYVLANGQPCNQAVGYTIQRDDDYNKVRCYNSFCPTHAAIVAANADETEE